jgi:hypothetical protein
MCAAERAKLAPVAGARAPARRELEVMEALASSGVDALAADAQVRVLRWFTDYLGLPAIPVAR